MFRINNKYIWIFIDICFLNIALLLAIVIRFGYDLRQYFFIYRQNIIFIIIAYLIFSSIFRLYNFYWRYISIKEMFHIILVVALTTFFTMYLRFLPFGGNIPRTVIFLFFFFSLSTLIGNKVFWRFYHENRLKMKKGNNRILVVGAGDAGDVISREISRRPNLGNLIGFVDDDKSKTGMNIHGRLVLGTTDDIPQLIQNKNVDQIIIAMPSASGKQIKRIVNRIPKKSVDIKTLPGLYELVDGNVSYSKVRNIEIEDILGREQVNLNIKTISEYLTEKTVLITGAGGSIGSEIARQVSQFHPGTLILLDNSENNLYSIFYELRNKYKNVELVPLLLNITNKPRLKNIFQSKKPAVVFHAAAHKHVPILEYYPEEAIWNNIIGTKNIAALADKYGAERMIMISTDKAINPTSVMGVSKRIAEMIMTDYGNKSKTRFMAVRFGNVLGSSGSVVPLFRKQIAEGGPVTVTDKEVKRYFMTIPEASQLVIQAGVLGDSGQVFVLDMGEPIKVYDLAVDMIKLMGFEPNKDIDITIVGLRPGEKLFEELMTEEEKSNASSHTSHEKIFIARVGEVDGEKLAKGISELEELALEGDAEKIIMKLQEIVPNYNPTRNKDNLLEYQW